MAEREILAVDDEPMICDLYRKGFERAGYSVRTAESAEAALALQQAAPSLLLFSDLKLPGMNGVDLCRRFRKDWPFAICYAVTGYASLFELSECRDAGFEDYFVKPVNLAHLLKAADQAWEKLERWKRRNDSADEIATIG